MLSDDGRMVNARCLSQVIFTQAWRASWEFSDSSCCRKWVCFRSRTWRTRCFNVCCHWSGYCSGASHRSLDYVHHGRCLHKAACEVGQGQRRQGCCVKVEPHAVLRSVDVPYERRCIQFRLFLCSAVCRTVPGWSKLFQGLIFKARVNYKDVIIFFFCITGSGVDRVGAHQGLLPGELQHSLITSPAVGSWIREGVRKGGIFSCSEWKKCSHRWAEIWVKGEPEVHSEIWSGISLGRKSRGLKFGKEADGVQVVVFFFSLSYVGQFCISFFFFKYTKKSAFITATPYQKGLAFLWVDPLFPS